MVNGEAISIDEYTGKWVAISRGKVISFNKDPDKVVKEVLDKYPNENPVFHRVTDPNELWAI